MRTAITTQPVIILPSHRSYLDFLLVSYFMLELGIQLPAIAAGEGKKHLKRTRLIRIAINTITQSPYNLVILKESYSSTCISLFLRFVNQLSTLVSIIIKAFY